MRIGRRSAPPNTRLELHSAGSTRQGFHVLKPNAARQRHRISHPLCERSGPVPNHPERAHEEERERSVRHQELG
jgi:hypothetical protein